GSMARRIARGPVRWVWRFMVKPLLVVRVWSVDDDGTRVRTRPDAPGRMGTGVNVCGMKRRRPRVGRRQVAALRSGTNAVDHGMGACRRRAASSFSTPPGLLNGRDRSRVVGRLRLTKWLLCRSAQCAVGTPATDRE